MATKRKKLIILEKVKIIHEVENNSNMPAIQIAQKFNHHLHYEKETTHFVFN
jgi:hypothetical protein